VIGLPFFSVVGLTVRAFYAIKDTATPVRIAGIDFLINIVVTVLLVFGLGLGVVGIAIASTTAIIAQTALLARALSRRFPGIGLARLLPSLGKVLAGTALMAVVVAAGWRALSHAHLSQRLRDLVAVLGLIPAGVVVYGAAIWLLRIDGREEIAALLRRRPRDP
jgi:putative peptidoglycan lipid II flippase